MKLLIHDFNENEWEKIATDYEGFEVVSGKGGIKPCTGCFGCWLKTPGECVIKDDYNRMGELIHKADEMVIMSKFTYGGFSSCVKNVLDRSIGYVLPFFRIVNDEMHHKPRYQEIKPISIIFRADAFSDEDKEKAKKCAEAVCLNLNGDLKEIRFEAIEDSKEHDEFVKVKIHAKNDETLLLNCSLRGNNANSKKFLDVIEGNIKGEIRRENISAYLNNMDELCGMVMSAQKLVLGMPLYVDGIPSTPLKLMEMVQMKCSEGGLVTGDKRIYVVSNMGFYESSQISNLLSMVKKWCEICGFSYGGGIAIGAGEMMGQVLGFGHNGPGKYVYEDIIKLAKAIDDGDSIDDLYTKANKFPRFLYMLAGNSGMKKSAKLNGLSMKEVLKN